MTDVETSYSTSGLRTDLRFGLFLATVLSLMALLLIAVAAVANLAAKGAHESGVTPWSALLVLVIAMPTAYYLAALIASLLAFSLRPVRRGAFGNALVGFIGGSCGMGTMAIAWKIFPEQFEYLSRHPSFPVTPMPAGLVVLLTLLGGGMGVIFGLRLYSQARRTESRVSATPHRHGDSSPIP